MFLSCGLQEVHILRVKMHNKRLSTDILLATDLKECRKISQTDFDMITRAL